MASRPTIKETDIGSENTSAVGVPYSYDKTANAVFLDPKPNYSVASGLKMMINREATYFTTTDTTKKPGFAGSFHEYLALVPCYKFALRSSRATANGFKNEILEMEKEMKAHYGKRERDARKVLTGKFIEYQ